jgi:hypothetical protein
MQEVLLIDAYRILGLSWSSEEEAIRLAYHKQVRSGQDLELFSQAYELIRDKTARERYSWDSIHSYFHPPKEESQEALCDFVALAAELAFLSDWELEDLDES